MKLLTLTLIGLCCLSAQAPAMQTKDDVTKPAPNEPDLNRLIDLVLNGKAQISDFQLHVHWAGQFGQFRGRDAVVYGKGVGILNRKTQFTLTKNQIHQLLTALKEGKLSALKRSYGGMAFPGRGGPVRRPPERLIGGVTVTIGGFTKSAQQMGGGEQSKALADLADSLLTICEKAAKANPVTAASLGVAIKKLSTGDLLPETMKILVHRIIQKQPLNLSEGFLMRIEGRDVTVQRRIPKKGYGPKQKLVLSNKELRKLTEMLAKNQPDQFPVNLWAKHYTDFNVEVLQHRKSMQARQFARLTPKTHGEKQKQFDRIFESMEALAKRAFKEGKTVKEPPR